MQYRRLDPSRVLLNDLLGLARSCLVNHHIIEVDFTSVDHFRARYHKDTGRSATYVACTLLAVGQTLRGYPELNSYLQKLPTRRLVIYDDVDISMGVERMNNNTHWVSRSILRKANNKNFNDIVEFLDAARHGTYREDTDGRASAAFLKLPSLIRRLVMHSYLMTSPRRMQRAFGTCAFTSVGKFGTTITTPLSPRTVTFSLGSVRERPIVRDGSVVPAKTGYITITYDHRVADGADVARMGNDLCRFLESFDERVDAHLASLRAVRTYALGSLDGPLRTPPAVPAQLGVGPD